MSRKQVLNLACTAHRFAKPGETMLNFRCLFLRMVKYMMSFSMKRGPRAGLSLLLCASLCLPGVAAPAKKDAPPAPNMGAAASGMTASLPDPKFPGTGKLLYYLRAAGFNGQFLPDGSIHGSMTKIWARLYQKGVPSAVLTAPQAQGGGTGKSIVITGKGGVVVKSLTEPGTILTADTVVWYAVLNKIVATGHVFYHNGKNGGTVTGPVMNADSKLRSVTFPTGVHARMSL